MLLHTRKCLQLFKWTIARVMSTRHYNLCQDCYLQEGTGLVFSTRNQKFYECTNYYVPTQCIVILCMQQHTVHKKIYIFTSRSSCQIISKSRSWFIFIYYCSKLTWCLERAYNQPWYCDHQIGMAPSFSSAQIRTQPQVHLSLLFWRSTIDCSDYCLMTDAYLIHYNPGSLDVWPHVI